MQRPTDVLAAQGFIGLLKYLFKFLQTFRNVTATTLPDTHECRVDLDAKAERGFRKYQNEDAVSK